MLFYIVLPKISIDGPRIAHIGEIVSITCTILEGRPVPDIWISSPLGVIAKSLEITFSAEVNHTGYYTCTGNISTQFVTEDHYLLVYSKKPDVCRVVSYCFVDNSGL